MSFILCSISAEETQAFLQSFSGERAHTQGGSTEIIVVFQGALEDHAQMSIASRCDRLVVLEQRGLSAARNVGIKHATGDWLAFPDDDCWYESGSIGSLVDQLESVDSQCAVASIPWPERDGRLVSSGTGLSRRFPTSGLASIQVVARHVSVREVGGFDERLGLGAEFPGAEETDLLHRITSAGSPHVRRLADIAVHHPWGNSWKSQLSARERRAEIFRRGLGYGGFRAKHGRRLPASLMAAARYSLRGAFGQPGFLDSCAMAAGQVAGVARWNARYRRGA